MWRRRLLCYPGNGISASRTKHEDPAADLRIATLRNAVQGSANCSGCSGQRFYGNAQESICAAQLITEDEGLGRLAHTVQVLWFFS
ncbi:unnamed protein product [Boreogadus saida]